jgi:hypothetical protein
METLIMEAGLMGKDTVKEYLIGLKKEYIMEIGIWVKCKEKVLIYLNQGIFRKDYGRAIYLFLNEKDE